MIKRIVATLVLVLISTIAGFAQNGVEVRIGLHLNANQSSKDWNNVGLNGQVGYNYEGIKFLADGYGSDSLGARTRYSVDYQVPYTFRAATFRLGAGYYRFGLQNGIFGQAQWNYKKYEGLIRVGGSRMADAEVAYYLSDLGNKFTIHPTYRYTHQEVSGTPYNFHQFGLAVRFKEH